MADTVGQGNVKLRDFGDGTFGTLAGGSVPVLSIPAGSSATTTTPVVLDNVVARALHSAVIIPAGTLTAGVVTLQGSLDGQNWVTIVASGALSGSVPIQMGGAAQSTTQATVFRYVRAAITTTVTGTTIAVWVASA